MNPLNRRLQIVETPADLEEARQESRREASEKAYAIVHKSAQDITRLLYRSDREVPTVQEQLVAMIRQLQEVYDFQPRASNGPTQEQVDTNDEGVIHGDDN